MNLICSNCGGEKDAAIFPPSEKAKLLKGNEGLCGDCLRKYNTASRRRGKRLTGVVRGGAWRGESNSRLFASENR